MTVKPKPPTDLWQQMDSLRSVLYSSPEPPRGAFTAKDYATKYNLSSSTAREQIAKLRESGKLMVAAVLRNVRYYRPS